MGVSGRVMGTCQSIAMVFENQRISLKCSMPHTVGRYRNAGNGFIKRLISTFHSPPFVVSVAIVRRGCTFPFAVPVRTVVMPGR